MAKAPTKTKPAASIDGQTKTLIIAEKPSVANDIAKALGGFQKYDDYFENADFATFFRKFPTGAAFDNKTSTNVDPQIDQH